MGKVTIPVKVRQPEVEALQTGPQGTQASTERQDVTPPQTDKAQAPTPIRADTTAEEAVVPEEQQEWRDLALRLQAEMKNYRKRQRRLAQDQIEFERERVLSILFRIVDDLERALAAPVGDNKRLREGIQLIHRASFHQLRQEGVERIEAKNQPFDPNWHEAVSTVPSNGMGVAPDTVVQVLEPGYRLGDRLLRPAKVVVAM
ncbi:MAG: nucleotide exchange factor GrpE [Anaerolineae bacterium]|jgi:molecular chaperone GrpE